MYLEMLFVVCGISSGLALDGAREETVYRYKVIDYYNR